MSRLTPFDVAFGEPFQERFSAIRREATAQSLDPTDPGQFASLRSVQRILSEIESPEVIDATPQAAVEYLTLLYAAFRYWEAGETILGFEPDVFAEERAVELLAAIPVPVPDGGCYLQLPERLVWSQIDPEAPHEPLDGLFVAQSGDGEQYTVVAILGLRPEREGFSQISVTAAAADLTELPGVMRSPPFAPTMDGGAAAGFRSVTSAGELLLLAQLALARAAE